MPPNFLLEIRTIHGQGWKALWTVYEVEENRPVIAYQHFPDECPFPYRARQIFELNSPSLPGTLSIINSGKTEMHAGMGMHPYFVRRTNNIITVNIEKMLVNDS